MSEIAQKGYSMFSLTLIFAVIAFFVLAATFGLAYWLKGPKAALIATGIAFSIFALLFAGGLYVIVSSMPN
jgi:hypothetical protein